MAGKVMHLLERGGRYSARVVVPIALRASVGRSELVEALGGDRRLALQRLPAAVARFQSILEAARQRQARGAPPKPHARGKRLSIEAMARDRYATMTALDQEIRESDHTYAGASFDDGYVADLRRAKSGAASNEELAEIVGRLVEGYRLSGNTDLTPAAPEFRKLAMALATAEYEAMAVAAARDEGDLAAATTHPMLQAPSPLEPAPGSARIISADSTRSLSDLLPLYVAEKRSRPGTRYEYEVGVRMFEEHLGELKPVHAITPADVVAYKRALMDTPANYSKRFPGKSLPEAIRLNKARAKPFPTLSVVTINDKWLARLKALLAWCKADLIIPDNPAEGIKVDGVERKAPSRVPFTSNDIERIFGAASFQKQKAFTEKEWAMLIALHSGFRASEIAQIRLESLRLERGILVLAIEEQVKTRSSTRLVPVHSSLIRLGIETWAEKLRAQGSTHLFPLWFAHGEKLRRKTSGSVNQPFSQVIPRWFNRTFLPSVGIHDERKVFHSFRHTLKTALARAGVPRSVSDDITGHDDRSAGGVYVHETSVEALAEALEKIKIDGFDL